MAYRHDRQDHNIRSTYERALGLFSEREVTYKRVVNVVERRSALPYDTQRYSGSRSYQDQDIRGYHSKIPYTGSNNGRYYGESSHFSNVRRNTSPPRKEESYPYYRGTRDSGPVMRQVEMSRSSGRAGSLPSSGGQGLGPPSRSMSTGIHDRAESQQKQEPMYLDRREDYEDTRWREVYTEVRDRSHSPIRRELQPPALAPLESTTSSRSYSPERDKGYSYQQIQQRRYEESCSQNRELDKPRLPSPSIAFAEVPVKDDPPAPGAEPEKAGMVNEEPEEDFKTRRSRQIATKALEIEKLYMQDCETFSTVVKMLVDKAPNLDQLLQAPLKENLTAIKERCLEDLKQFISELDHATQRPEISSSL